MFYMRPSRYIPSETSTKTIINNLAYVIQSMQSRSSYAETHGIGFIANMDDWTMSNFDIQYCYQFMFMLQGYVIPVKVQLFLIVNPPSWFGKVWKIMKRMMIPSFRKKVKMITHNQLDKYLQDDYLTYLPNDGMDNIGQVNVDELVEDFITYRTYVDEISIPILSQAEERDEEDDSDFEEEEEEDPDVVDVINKFNQEEEEDDGDDDEEYEEFDLGDDYEIDLSPVDDDTNDDAVTAVKTATSGMCSSVPSVESSSASGSSGTSIIEKSNSRKQPHQKLRRRRRFTWSLCRGNQHQESLTSIGAPSSEEFFPDTI